MIVQGSHDAGGLYRFKQQAFLCEAHGLRVNRHAFMESEISFHANAQVASTIPNLTLGNQVMHQLLAERLTLGPAPALDGGRFRPGDAPGHGFELDHDAVARAHERWQRDGAYNTIESREVNGAETIVDRRRDPRRDHAVGARARGHGAAAARGRPLRRGLDRASRPRSCAATTRTPRSCGWPFHSRERLRQLPLHLDCEPVYTRCGWLFLVDAESARSGGRELDDAGGGGRRQRRGRRPARVPAGRRRRPGSRTRSSSPTRASPIRSRRRAPTSRRARRAGAEALEGTPVEAIEVAGGAVRGVRVGGELIECDSVVLAAGPWSVAARARDRARAAARDHARAGRRLRRPRPSRRSRARSRRRPTGSTCARRPSTATATSSSAAASRRTTSTVDPDAFDDTVDDGVRGGRPRPRRHAAARASRACGRRRPRRPVRRDARLAPAARPGRRLRGAAPRDRRQRPLLQARRRRSASSSPARSSASRRATRASRRSRCRASPRAASSGRATAGTARERCGRVVALL